jgi:hypothetical protein
MSEIKYAFYSAKSVKAGFSSFLYESPDGKQVKCTTVCDTPHPKGYLWPDVKSRGPVTKFIREIKSPRKPSAVLATDKFSLSS